MEEPTSAVTTPTASPLRTLWRNYIWPLLLSLLVIAALYLLLPMIPEAAINNVGRSFIILIGGILPSIIYRYFTQQRLPTFLREYKQNLRRLGLPQNSQQYQDKFEAVYGEATQGSQIAPFNSPVFITTLLTFIGWAFVFYPLPDEPTGLIPNANPFAYGFLGAYIFGMSSLALQFVTDDLQPRYYASLTIRFVTVIVLSWTVDLIRPNDDNVLLVAFFIGLFPTVGLRVIQRLVTAVLGVVSAGFEENLPLSELDGLNAYHEDRLRLEGIENIQNLASANIVDLMLRTRFPIEQIIDWMDQALLKIHARDRFEDFRRSSLRTATDFMDAYEATNLVETAVRDYWRQKLASLLDSQRAVAIEPAVVTQTGVLIETLYYALQRDPNLFQIRYWRDHEFEALPEDIEAERTKADLKLMQGLPDEAITIYDRLIQKYDYSHNLYLYRGLAYASKGDYTKAIEDYNQVIDSTLTNRDTIRQAYLYRFRAQVALGEYDEAVENFNQDFVEGFEGFAEAQMDLAVAQLTYQGQYAEAIKNLNQVIESGFNVAEALANRGLAYYQYSRTEQMTDAEKETALKTARDDLERALRLKPSLIPFYINLAIILGDWGELGEKERVLSAALDQLQAKPNKDYAYRVRLERGYLYSKEERYEEAANDFERATRLSPDQSTAYFFYGTALRKLGRLAAALAALQRAAALDPESKEVHEELGDVLLARSEYDRAERAYITALQLARETADKSAETRAHLGLGQVYRHLKRWLDAERELRNAINLAGEDDAETVATAEFELGLVQLKKGDKDAAILQFANSAVLFEVYGDARASANAYHYLAQTQIEEKQYDEALESLQNAQQRLNSVFIPGDTEDQELQEKIQREMTQLISLNGQEPPAANGGGG